MAIELNNIVLNDKVHGYSELRHRSVHQVDDITKSSYEDEKKKLKKLNMR